MELYILDSALRRTAVVDRFESLIWTERFVDVGDFELIIHSTIESRSTLTIDTLLATNVSYRVMKIETITNKKGVDGRSMLTVKGRSLEVLMADRVAKNTLSDLTTEPTWILTGTPGDIARSIFQDICVTGALSISDIIPYMTAGNVFPADGIAEFPDVMTIELNPGTVYASIKAICDVYDLGFRLYRNLDTSQLMFNVYSGNDRTTQQSVLPAVVFSPDLDNLQDMAEYTSISEYKNVAYVFSPAGYKVVYAIGASATTVGFARRVLLVDASDITETDPVLLDALLLQRGTDELSKNRPLAAFDGEIPQNGDYKYGTHYELGDLVEMRNSDGITNNMRVTEQIFVADTQGERSYPTLTINLFITPGSWYAWDYNQVWADAVGTWDEA